jgi:hypothetical protein
MPQNTTKHRKTPQKHGKTPHMITELPCHKKNDAKHQQMPENTAKHLKTPQNAAKCHKYCKLVISLWGPKYLGGGLK